MKKKIVICPLCLGKGLINNELCKKCLGDKYINENELKEVIVND